MKKKIAMLLCLLMCLSVFGSLSITAADAEVTYSVDGVVDETVTTLSSAMTKANTLTEGQTATITLLKNMTYTTMLTYTGAGNLIFDGNGKKITTNKNGDWNFTFYMNGTGVFTVTDTIVENTNTTVTNKATGVVLIEKGNMVINNCNFKTNYSLFYVTSATSITTLDINGGQYVSGRIGNAILNTASSDTATAQLTATIDDAVFAVTNPEAYNVMVLGKGVSGSRCDKLTFTNTDIYAPGAVTLVNALIADSSVAFNSCNIYLPHINSNSKMFSAVLKSSISFNKTNFVGGQAANGYIGNTPTDYAYSSGIAAVFFGTIADDKPIYLPALAGEASVRLDEAGIRFRTNLSKTALASYKTAALAFKSDENTVEDVTVSYGTLVVLQSELNKVGVTVDDMTNGDNKIDCYNLSKGFLDALGIGYVDIVADKGITNNDDGSVTYVAALDGITEDYYDAGIATIAYVKASVGGEDFYFYSSFDPNKNTHCIKDVAQQAIDSGNYSGADLEQLQKYAGIASTGGN